jgi:hypothetical protein
MAITLARACGVEYDVDPVDGPERAGSATA